MPLVDMPLEQLKQYRGTNPRPADFDRFWDDALAEMHAVDPKVEMKPAKFVSRNADCYDLFYTGVGGARIHAQLLIPKGLKEKAPAILQFPGYSCDAGNWCGKLGYVNDGFVVAAFECRGQAGQSEDKGGVLGNTLHGHIIRGLADKPEKLLYRSVFLDTAELAEIVMGMDCVDETRVAVQGGSQGGGLSLACAALVPGINRAAVCYPFLSDYRRVWEMDLIRRAYAEIADFFRRSDPCHEQEDLYFERLGYIDIHNLAARIKADVWMAVGLMDDCCPPSTQFAAYNNMTCRKEMVIYHDFGHEELPWVWDKIFAYMSTM